MDTATRRAGVRSPHHPHPEGFPLGSLVKLIHGFHYVIFRQPAFAGAPGYDLKGGSQPTTLYCLFSSAGRATDFYSVGREFEPHRGHLP